MTRLRGLAALVGTVAFVVGVPWLLLRYGHWPIDHAPSASELRHLIDTVVSDTMVFGVLTVAAWVVWAVFAVSLLVETAAALRGVQAPRLAFAGPLQRSARALVAAIVLAVSLSHQQPAAFAASRGASSTALARPAAQVAQIIEPIQHSQHPGSAEAADGELGDVDPAHTGPAVTVARGDSAWALAEQHLGDGMRWREIWELNRDRPQPDGRAWTDPQRILAGWQLLLPADTNPPAAETASAPEQQVHVVVQGDTLSSIARAHLGDPDRYLEIFDLNRDVVQPDSLRLTDPDLIVPGWQLRLPAPQPAAEVADPAPTTDGSPPLDTAGTAVPAPEPTSESPTSSTMPPPPDTTPTTTPSPAPAETDVAAVPVPTTAPTPTDQPTELAPAATAGGEVEDDESWWAATAPVLAGVSGATVLATGLLLSLRRSQRRRVLRGAGNTSTQGSDTERAVVAAADVPLVRWAGQALAEMISRIGARDAASSAPVAVELSPESGIEVLWDTPNPKAPAPWIVADEGWAWRLTYDPDAEAPVDELSAAIPALVTIGHREGRQLMIDLEAFGTVAVSGDRDRVENFLRSVALELSTGDDLADSYVVTVELDGVTTSDRLTSSDPATANDRASSVFHSVRAALDNAASPTTFAYRCGADGAHLETTAVIVAANEESDAFPLPEAPARSGVAIVVAGENPSAAAHIDIATDGTARLEPLGVSFVAAGVSNATASALETLPADPPGDDEAVAPSTNGHRTDQLRMDRLAAPNLNGDAPALFELPDDDTEQEVAGAPTRSPLDASLVVKVLGTPRIPDRPDIKRRELRLAVYLACRGGRVNASAVQDALWNGQAVQGKTVWNLVGRTRTALGRLPDGSWVLEPSDRNRRMKGLSPAVTTDLAILRYLSEQAQTVSSSEAIGVLRQALALIEGPPFDAEGYDWAHHGTQDVAEASRLIEQATEQLVNLALDVDDIDLAREALAQGLRGLPGDEVLYRLRMKVEHHAGNLTGVSAAFDELVRHLADFDTDPSPSTLDLRRELLGVGRATGTWAG